MAVEYREAQLQDAQQVARLLDELGYKDNETAVRRRIERVLGLTDHVIMVAIERPHGVQGIVHAEVLVTLMARPRATVHALAVTADARQAGIGRELLERVHGWALRRGIDDVQISMQRTRKEAHGLLMKLGYSVNREHLVYERDLAVPADADPRATLDQ